MNKREFERAFRGRYKIKDPDFVKDLLSDFEADFDDAGENKNQREDVWRVIDRQVRSYNSGRARERIERERVQADRDERIDEKQVTIQPHAGAYETARVEALSEYIAKVASANPVTINYRKRILGRRLTANEAELFLSSPIAATASVRIDPRARPCGVECLNFEIEEQAEDDGGPYRVLRYRYAGRNVETRLRPLLLVPGRGEFAWVYPGDTIYFDEGWQQIPGRDADGVLLPTPSGDYVVAKSNSALDRLAEQGSKLARRYLLEPRTAIWFILTGERPEPKFMSARLNSLGTDDLSRAVLTLTVEPWVPPERVKTYYQEIRNHVLRSSGSLNDRTVAVFRFVVSHMEVKGTALTHPKLKHLAELWNEQYSEGDDWYFADYRAFRRSYVRGRDALVFPFAG